MCNAVSEFVSVSGGFIVERVITTWGGYFGRGVTVWAVWGESGRLFWKGLGGSGDVAGYCRKGGVCGERCC